MNLDERVAREKQAYNGDDFLDKSIKLHGRFWHVFASPNSERMEQRFMDEIGDTKGKVVLDYGCYNGELSQEISKNKPKRIEGIDISERGIAAAKKKKIPKSNFQVMDAHKTNFKDNTFDLVIGKSILHHLDWEIALKEIRRILKPGGVAVFTEPLNINPFAKMLRAVTKEARTHDEAALVLSQLKQSNKIFGASHHSYYNLASVPVGMLTSLVMKKPDNIFLKVTDVVDLGLAKTPLKYWARAALLKWEKKD